MAQLRLYLLLVVWAVVTILGAWVITGWMGGYLH